MQKIRWIHFSDLHLGNIFDKFKIKSASLDGDKLLIEMMDKTVVLEVEHV